LNFIEVLHILLEISAGTREGRPLGEPSALAN
jgi:hypothetical protein